MSFLDSNVPFDCDMPLMKRIKLHWCYSVVSSWDKCVWSLTVQEFASIGSRVLALEKQREDLQQKVDQIIASLPVKGAQNLVAFFGIYLHFFLCFAMRQKGHFVVVKMCAPC